MTTAHYEINKRWRKKNNNIWQIQKKRYYDKTVKTSSNRYQRWTLEQIGIILNHKNTDTNIAKQIGKSVKAIQIKRGRTKEKYHEKENSKKMA